MTIKEMMEFNKRYSFIACVIDFQKDTDLIIVKNISSVDLICGFGDSGDFNKSLMDESWDDLFEGKWGGDGYYSVEIVYKNVRDNDGYQYWTYHEVEDIKFYKYDEAELNYHNTIPFDWDNLDLNI
jgi:hypothetical protein